MQMLELRMNFIRHLPVQYTLIRADDYAKYGQFLFQKRCSIKRRGHGLVVVACWMYGSTNCTINLATKDVAVKTQTVDLNGTTLLTRESIHSNKDYYELTLM